MKRKEQIKTGLFCVGVLLLVLACMALPSVFCAMQQGRLLQTSHSRPAEENALSRQGQENALAKLLYDRQFLAGQRRSGIPPAGRCWSKPKKSRRIRLARHWNICGRKAC